MINAVFHVRNNNLCGFTVKGHAGYDEEGFDIVCASVSSVTIMTANTISEILKVNAEIETDDGYISLILKSENTEAENLINGLQLFLSSLCEQYPLYLKIDVKKGLV